MSEILQATAKQINLRRTSDGGLIELRATLDGSLITAPWYLALLLEGSVFGTNNGTGTDPYTSSATYANTTPDLSVDTVAGIAMLPLAITLGLDMTWANETDSEAIASVSNTIAAADGTQTIVNLRTDSPRASQCAAEVAGVANVTGGSAYFEFFRESVALAGGTPDLNPSAVLSMFRWSVLDGIAPMVVGAGNLGLWMSTNAANDVFATAVWAELPVTAVP